MLNPSINIWGNKMNYMIILFLFIGISFAKEKTVQSKVVEATVFKDRAMVTRTATVNLTKGMNTIIFPNLTTDIRDASVTISLQGSDAKILDVKVERKFTTKSRKKDVEEIKQKIESLSNQKQKIRNKISVFNSKKDFIESLKAESIKYANQKILLNTSSTKKWSNLLSFVDTNLSAVYNGIYDQEVLKKEIDKEIKKLKQPLGQFNGAQRTDYKIIIAKISSDRKQSLKVRPSYLVNNASWYSMYDARVSSAEKEVELTYYGMVRQTTGEDWNDVKLTFSTVDPVSVKSLPKLEDWFLDVRPLPQKNKKKNIRSISNSNIQVDYDQNWGLPDGKGAIAGYVSDAATGEPLVGVNIVLTGSLLGISTDRDGRFYIANVPAKNYTVKVTYIGYQDTQIKMEVYNKHTANMLVQMEESAMESDEIIVTAQRPFLRKSVANSTAYYVDGLSLNSTKKSLYSNVKAKDLSTTFELKTKNTIPSDNTSHKITIDVRRQPISFEYTAVPKVVEKVYLKGKVINQNEFPLLAGEINVFMENDFVNRTLINTIVPSDTMELALGIDDGIKIEKKLKNKFSETKGLLGGDRQITYDYEIIITNNRRSEEEITIIDQLPLAMNEKINIEVIAPKRENKKKGENPKLVWKVKVKPGEQKSLPLKFKIDFPANLRIYGLE